MTEQPTPVDTKEPEGSGPPPEHEGGQEDTPNDPKPDLDDDPER